MPPITIVTERNNTIQVNNLTRVSRAAAVVTYYLADTTTVAETYLTNKKANDAYETIKLALQSDISFVNLYAGVQIDSINPPTLSPDGGETVTIIGKNLLATASIKINGVALTGLAVNADGSIVTGTSPVMARGTYSLTYDDSVTAVITKTNAIQYEYQYYISDIIPETFDAGLASGMIRVIGKGFSQATIGKLWFEDTTGGHDDNGPSWQCTYISSVEMTAVFSSSGDGQFDVNMIVYYRATDTNRSNDLVATTNGVTSVVTITPAS